MPEDWCERNSVPEKCEYVPEMGEVRCLYKAYKGIYTGFPYAVSRLEIAGNFISV